MLCVAAIVDTAVCPGCCDVGGGGGPYAAAMLGLGCHVAALGVRHELGGYGGGLPYGYMPSF